MCLNIFYLFNCTQFLFQDSLFFILLQFGFHSAVKKGKRNLTDLLCRNPTSYNVCDHRKHIRPCCYEKYVQTKSIELYFMHLSHPSMFLIIEILFLFDNAKICINHSSSRSIRLFIFVTVWPMIWIKIAYYCLKWAHFIELFSMHLPTRCLKKQAHADISETKSKHCTDEFSRTKFSWAMDNPIWLCTIEVFFLGDTSSFILSSCSNTSRTIRAR